VTQNILIIGSGWLGLPLAKSLINQGHQVTATTTSREKISNKILPIIHLNTDDDASLASINDSFDVMIITIAPQRKNPEHYLEQLQTLHQLAIRKKFRKVLFTSSTSVWGNNEGIVNEMTTMMPVSESAKAMVSFEAMARDASEYKATIIKLAGLISGERHPGRFLAGKTAVDNPQAPVNLVAKEDVIGLISQIINQQQWQQSFIACAPSHPSRYEFYTQAAQQLNLTPPAFSSNNQPSKHIDGQATARHLNYQYKFPDLLTWLSLH